MSLSKHEIAVKLTEVIVTHARRKSDQVDEILDIYKKCFNILDEVEITAAQKSSDRLSQPLSRPTS